MLNFGRATLDDPPVAAVLERHIKLMRSQTPEDSCHVLPVDAFTAPDVHLFALRDAGNVVAIGALRVCGPQAELKSMHTVSEHRGRGLGRRLLSELTQVARALGAVQLVLETGSGPEHSSARGLYLSEGFSECGPFGDYTADPLSVFMHRPL